MASGYPEVTAVVWRQSFRWSDPEWKGGESCLMPIEGGGGGENCSEGGQDIHSQVHVCAC